MKVNKINSVLKESMSYDALILHIKHVTEYKDDARFSGVADDLIRAINAFGNIYNAVADNLANQPAGMSTSEKDNIVGYVNQEGNHVKYDKTTKDVVIYNPRSPIKKTLTLHKKSWEWYLYTMKRDYQSELPENSSDD